MLMTIFALPGDWHPPLLDVLGCAAKSNALRLVAAEADLLPGLIVDQYADYLVVQFLTAAADAWRTSVVSALQQICQPAGI